MSSENVTAQAPVRRLVGLVCVFVKLCLLPIMAAVEVPLLMAVFLTGLIQPRYALRLNDWFCDHLPDRDWYWERPMNVRSAQANASDHRAADKETK